MSSTACAAALAIALCTLLQGCSLSLQVQVQAGRACVQQYQQPLVCVAWPPYPVESLPRAG